MTYDEKVEKAREYLLCLRLENLLKSRVQSMKDRAISLNSALSPVCAENNELQSGIERSFDRLQEVQSALIAAAEETEKHGLALDIAMATLKQEEFAIIQKRYIEGKTFAEIANYMNLTLRRVYQIHRNAINKMWES